MTEAERSRSWKDVDGTRDPRSWATYLEKVSLVDAFREYKRRALAMLEPRPGGRYLEVGCGTGVDTRALAAMVVPGGAVVGLDFSAALLAEARAQAAGLAVEYVQGDAHRLDFAEASFDGCRADRVFQHLNDPGTALREMVRVARPGAPIVVTEPDWETYVLDVPDRALFRKLVAHHVDAAQQNGWIGRELPRLFTEAGLVDVRVVPEPLYAGVNDYELVMQGTGLEERATTAAKAGVISEADAARWRAELAAQRASGRFWLSMLLFTVRGRKPA